MDISKLEACVDFTSTLATGGLPVSSGPSLDSRIFFCNIAIGPGPFFGLSIDMARCRAALELLLLLLPLTSGSFVVDCSAT